MRASLSLQWEGGRPLLAGVFPVSAGGRPCPGRCSLAGDSNHLLWEPRSVCEGSCRCNMNMGSIPRRTPCHTAEIHMATWEHVAQGAVTKHHQNLFPHSSRGQKSKIKVSAGLVFARPLSLQNGLQMAIFSLCHHMVFPLWCLRPKLFF